MFLLAFLMQLITGIPQFTDDRTKHALEFARVDAYIDNLVDREFEAEKRNPCFIGVEKYLITFFKIT